MTRNPFELMALNHDETVAQLRLVHGNIVQAHFAVHSDLGGSSAGDENGSQDGSDGR